MGDVEQLRQEMREDRDVLTTLITQRFDKLDDKIGALSTSQGSLAARVGVVEDRMSTFGRMIWGLVLAVAGGVLSWLKG